MTAALALIGVRLRARDLGFIALGNERRDILPRTFAKHHKLRAVSSEQRRHFAREVAVVVDLRAVERQNDVALLQPSDGSGAPGLDRRN